MVVVATDAQAQHAAVMNGHRKDLCLIYSSLHRNLAEHSLYPIKCLQVFLTMPSSLSMQDSWR